MFRYLYGAIIKSFNASVFIQYCICSMKTETAMFQPVSPGPGAVLGILALQPRAGRGAAVRGGAGLEHSHAPVRLGRQRALQIQTPPVDT